MFDPEYIAANVDILHVSGNKSEVHKVKKNFGKFTTVTDLGPCSQFLGTKMGYAE